MDLRSTINKMRETAKTEQDFLALMETMKRKASKGLLEDITPEDIDNTLLELDSKEEKTLSDISDLSAELMEADRYFDNYLDSLSDNELSHLLAEQYCQFINEGMIGDAISSGWEKVKDGAKAAGGIISGTWNKIKDGFKTAFNPATGAAIGPAVGAGVGIGIGAAGIAAIIARLRRRKRIQDTRESVNYLNNTDIKYIVENCNIDEDIVIGLLNCDNDDLAVLTEEVIEYSEDILIERYVDELDSELLEELNNTDLDLSILNEEREEVFYHTRRYNRRMNRAYENHPVRTAIGVGAGTAAAATGGVLAADAIVKKSQRPEVEKSIEAARTAAEQKAAGEGASKAATLAAGDAAAAGVEAQHATLASKAWNGIKAGAKATGEFIKNTPWVQGALVGAGVIGGGVLLAKLIKKIKKNRAEKAAESGLTENKIADTDITIDESILDKPIGEVLLEDLYE